MFGLLAGTLYGLWAGRAVSGRRLKRLGPLLLPDSSLILGWAEGNPSEKLPGDLSAPRAQSLTLRFKLTDNGPVIRF